MRITPVTIKNLTTGSNHTLLCEIEDFSDLTPTIIYQWTHFNGIKQQTVVGDNSRTMLFPHLRLSDAGEYTCYVNITSPILSSDIHAQSNTHEVLIECKYCMFAFLV